MDHNNDARGEAEPPPIQNRSDTGGPWSTAWSLIAVALIGLMLVRACLPTLPGTVVTTPASTAPSSR